MICDPWSIAVVLFPFSDLPHSKPRPALVLSTRAFNDRTGQTFLAMITTTQKTHWPDDVVIRDLSAAGLKRPSLVRTKLNTIDNLLIHAVIGELAFDERESVRQVVMSIMSPAP